MASKNTKVNVHLPNFNLNVIAYGFQFDSNGICCAEQDELQSLIDAEKVVVIDDLKAYKDALDKTVKAKTVKK